MQRIQNCLKFKFRVYWSILRILLCYTWLFWLSIRKISFSLFFFVSVRQTSDTGVLVRGIHVCGVAREYLSDAQLSLTRRLSPVSYVSGFACLGQCLREVRQCMNHPQLAVRCVGVREERKRSRVGYSCIHLLFFLCISCYYLNVFPLTVFRTKSVCFPRWPLCLSPCSPLFLILSIPISILVLSICSSWTKRAWGLWFEVWQTYRRCSVISPVFTTAEKVLNASLQGADGLQLPRPTKREWIKAGLKLVLCHYWNIPSSTGQQSFLG